MADTTASPVRVDWGALWLRFRRWRRYWLRDPIFGLGHYAIHYGSLLLPSETCSGVGAWLGRFQGKHLHDVKRRRSERMYRKLKGEPVSVDEAHFAVQRLFECVGRVALEFSVLYRLWAEGRIEVSGAEHLLRARDGGRPVIVMGLHLANWETIGPAMIGLGLRGVHMVYQPLPSRFDHHIVVIARRRYGMTLLRPSVTAARKARRLLVDERGVLLIFADDERRGYVSAPLFGRPIPPRANLPVIVRLALASGAEIIPAYVEHIAGARSRVIFLPPAVLDRGNTDDRATTTENVRRLDDIITPLVRAHLDQWYMLLDFKDRPYQG